MKHFETDFEQPDFIGEMMKAIENDYGCDIQRVARMEQLSNMTFNVAVIFTDYRLLEADIKITNTYGLPAIQIHGIYY